MVDKERGTLWWFHGLRLGAIRGFYGGLQRSCGIMQVLLKLLGLRVAHVVFTRPGDKQLGIPCGIGGSSNVYSLRLSLLSLSLRALTKPLWRKYSALRVLMLWSNKDDLYRVASRVRDGDVIVLDGLKGFQMVSPALNLLRRKSVTVIYLSHNYEADYYKGFSRWIKSREQVAVSVSDIVIAASQRDFVRYVTELDADETKIVVFPNIFPEQYKPMPKHSGKSLAVICTNKDIIRFLDIAIRLHAVNNIVCIGRYSEHVPPKLNGVTIRRYTSIPSRSEFLSVLSQAHAGLNHGTWLGGSNVKKFDYALSGLAIFSTGTGFRGEYLPGEIACTDPYDFAAKIHSLSTSELIKLGKLNKDKALLLFEKAVSALREQLRKHIAHVI